MKRSQKSVPRRSSSQYTGASKGVPRRRDRILLEVEKEVPTLEGQTTILHIHVNTGHMPLQAMPRTFKGAGVRPSIRRWVPRRAATMPRPYSINMVIGIDTIKVPSLSGIAGCRWYPGVSSWQSSSRCQRTRTQMLRAPEKVPTGLGFVHTRRWRLWSPIKGQD